MYIGSTGALTINVADIFKTPELTHIYNGGELNIMQDQGSMEHSIAEIYNAVGGILSISGYVYVDTLDNYGTTRLYQGSYIKGFNNQAGGLLEIWGRTYINNLNNNADGSLHFKVQDSPREEYASMQVDNFEGKINRDNLDVSFMKTSVFKVGKDNLYELINVKNGETGIADGLKDDALANTKADPMCSTISGNINEWSEYCQSKYTGELNNLINHAMWGRTDPPWLKREYSMEQNIDSNGNVNGESFYINIERLINYKGILDGIGVSDDFLNQISDVLDRSVDDLTVTDYMQDIYNSLDYNSGCVGQTPDEGEFIDGAHNNEDNTTDDTTIDGGGDKFNDWGNPCLQNLANNMKKLRPLDMEVFMFAHHNNTGQAIRSINQENKAYYGVKEFHIWQRSTFNANSFRAKKGYAGYKGMNGIIQLGVSGSVTSHWNFTGAVGLDLGNMVDDSYSSVLLGNQLGASLSYFSSYYYVSFSSMYNLTNYSNTRDVDFMNNQYVQNKETRAMSDMLMQELAFQVELGTGLSAWRISFDPKIILGASLISTPNFEETGSSASYSYQSNNTPLLEAGIGIDAYKETLVNNFLWVENVFVRPHSGLSFTKYMYPSTTTNVTFVGQSADYSMKVKGAGYSTLFSNMNLGVKFEKDNSILDISYGLEHNFSNYLNNSIQVSFKYVL